MSGGRHRALRWVVGGIAGVLVAAQLVRPALPDGPQHDTVAAPPDVLAVLRRSCFDCHSNETRLPWFDRIAPAYWLVVDDVRRGREVLNFSELGGQPPAAQRAALFEAVNHVRLGAMPPWRYTLVHRDAEPSARDVEVLEAWLHSVAPPPAHAVPVVAPASPSSVQPAPNGVAFPTDYATWRVVSSTERFDNATLRQVLGNDVAMRAIERREFPPWPDGTRFAKVAWQAVTGDDGVVGAGAFVQVELMEKDATRFADTGGWGWARWRGAQLQPYGSDASFTAECVGCHAPRRDADLVFTTPIERLAVDPLAVHPVAMTVDPAADTMSTLFGDDAAVDAGRAGTPPPADARLALVTWQRRDEPDWFGARVPGRLVSVDMLGRDGYERWDGSRQVAVDPTTAATRVAYMRSLAPLSFPGAVSASRVAWRYASTCERRTASCGRAPAR